MPLVLTTNDVIMNPDHAWQDETGVQYHYPNQYKNMIQPGVEFVYYRGVHRADGKRGQAEYFGRGRIGAIRLDPATEGASRPSWFCAIEDYEPFTPPVPAKVDGVFYEDIPQNMWRSGVRSLDAQTFAKILDAAGKTAAPVAPKAAGVVEVDNLIIPKGPRTSGATAGGDYRRSRRAKEIGDWAEKTVVALLEAQGGCAEIVHRAGQRETPGWDIDYRDATGVLQRVEVKGTVGGAFAAIDLTANELRAAREHGECYWIFLVSKCLTDTPRIQRVRNPGARLEQGDWRATPSLFSVRLG